MNMKKYTVLFVLLVTTMCVVPADFSETEKLIQKWIDKGYYAGAGLIVCSGDKVLIEKCWGDVSPESMIYIASAGKWLAAAAIMTLVDGKKLSLDDHAAKWLLDFQDAKGKATLRQMLAHTSGYPAYHSPPEPPDTYDTLKESVAHIAPLKPISEPGARWEYGGLAMQVAGRIAEVASEKNWETLFQDNIAKPLGLRNTRFTPVDQGFGHTPMIGGGARSTLRDYIRFLQMIAGNGQFGGRRILSEAAIKEMESDQVRFAVLPSGHFVERVRGSNSGIYGLGQWRECLDVNGAATLLSSPSWAGAYPWVDRQQNICGFFIAHVNVAAASKDKFNAMDASAAIPIIVRQTR